MNSIELKFDEVMSEVHTSYAAVLATLVNELAESRATVRKLSDRVVQLERVVRAAEANEGQE